MLSILSTIVIFSGLVAACPPEETIKPCDCKTFFWNPVLICRNLMSPEELTNPIQATAVTGAYVESLAIENSSLLYIPSSIFQNTRYSKIRFENSEIMSLSDTDVAFEGLEDTLTEIRAKDAHYVAQWDWKQLKNMKKLELIDVHDIEMGSVSESFPELKSLRFLGIIRAEISFIIQFAFHALTNLNVLNMKQNDISELSRNMLPSPAYNLISLDFSDNELSKLPADFFTNMPSLADVKLDNNKFVTLDRKVFTWALKNLGELTMSGNDFRCDCRLRWMAGGRHPHEFSGVCQTPEKMKGTPLRVLDLANLFC